MVEAKLLTNPIKRELVQVLLSKVQSVGAHKGVMISTAPFQQAAIEFANVHGALVAVTEGSFTYETSTLERGPALSREEAREMYGIPAFVGHHYEAGEAPGSIRRTTISTDYLVR